MIPVVVGGLRETSLVPEDLINIPDNILSFLGRTIKGNQLVPEIYLPLLNIPDNIL